MRTTIKNGENWIRVQYDVGKHGGSITSNLHQDLSVEGENADYALNGLESLILAHAVAGVDIEDTAYQEGVWTTVEAISNNC